MSDNPNDKISLTPVLEKLLSIDDSISDLDYDVNESIETNSLLIEKIGNTIEDFKFKMDRIGEQITHLDVKPKDNSEIVNSIKSSIENIYFKVNNDSRFGDLERLLLGISNSFEAQKCNTSETLEEIVEKNIILENFLKNILNILNNKNNFKNNNEEILKNFISLKTAIDKIGYSTSDKALETGILEKINLIESTLNKLSSTNSNDFYIHEQEVLDKLLSIKKTVDETKMSVENRTLLEKVDAIETSIKLTNGNIKEIVSRMNNEKVLELLDVVEGTLSKNNVESSNNFENVKAKITTVNDNIVEEARLTELYYKEILNRFTILEGKNEKTNNLFENLNNNFYNLNNKIEKINNKIENLNNLLNSIYEKLIIIESTITTTELYGDDVTDEEEPDEEEMLKLNLLENFETRIDSLEKAINRLLDSYMDNVGKG